MTVSSTSATRIHFCRSKSMHARRHLRSHTCCRDSLLRTTAQKVRHVNMVIIGACMCTTSCPGQGLVSKFVHTRLMSSFVDRGSKAMAGVSHAAHTVTGSMGSSAHRLSDGVGAALHTTVSKHVIQKHETRKVAHVAYCSTTAHTAHDLSDTQPQPSSHQDAAVQATPVPTFATRNDAITQTLPLHHKDAAHPMACKEAPHINEAMSIKEAPRINYPSHVHHNQVKRVRLRFCINSMPCHIWHYKARLAFCSLDEVQRLALPLVCCQEIPVDSTQSSGIVEPRPVISWL